MGALGRLDITTLMVCLALASALFAYAFFRMWGRHSSLRGSGAFALAFLLGTVTSILIPFVEPASPLLRHFNIILSDTLLLVVYAFLVTGIERFFGRRRLLRPAWGLVLFALALYIYFTIFHDSIVARLLISGACTCLYRLFAGIELLRQRPRKHLHTLAGLMLIFAGISLVGVWDIATHPSPRTSEQWLQSRGAESINVFLQFAFVLGTGQLLFLLLNGELLGQLETEASRDFITGILNRRAIERILDAEMRRSARFDLSLSIGLVDVDGFKQINDRLGHAEGDRALRAVSRAIQHALRAYDTVGRFGGDEFLVILPNSTASEALNVMERLRVEAGRLSKEAVTVSVGITSMLPNESPSDLIARADKALYLAKRDGRNCTRVSLAELADLVDAEAPLDVA